MPYYVSKTDWNIQSAVKPEDYNRLESGAGDQTMHMILLDTSGTANTYTVTPPAGSFLTQERGTRISVKINVTNTGASTLKIPNWATATKLLKNGGAEFASGQLKAGYIYNFVLDTAGFILVGEGGEYGTATVSDVIEGKTIGTDTGIKNGTMKNYAGKTPQKQWQEGITAITRLPEDTAGQGYVEFNPYVNGYVDQTTKMGIAVAALVPENIRHGANIGGNGKYMQGTFTSDGTVRDQDMPWGVVGYKQGQKVVGSVPLAYIGSSGAIGPDKAHFGSHGVTSGAFSGDGKIYAYMKPAPDTTRVMYDPNTWIMSHEPFLQPQYILEGATIMGTAGAAKRVGMEAGEGIIISDVEARGVNGTTWKKKKQFAVGYGGTYRLKWCMYAGGFHTNEAPIRCQIYKNGVAYSGVYSLEDPLRGYVWFQEDIPTNAGDTIELWLRLDFQSGTAGQIKDTMLCISGMPSYQRPPD